MATRREWVCDLLEITAMQVTVAHGGGSGRQARGSWGALLAAPREERDVGGSSGPLRTVLEDGRGRWERLPRVAAGPALPLPFPVPTSCPLHPCAQGCLLSPGLLPQTREENVPVSCGQSDLELSLLRLQLQEGVQVTRGGERGTACVPRAPDKAGRAQLWKRMHVSRRRLPEPSAKGLNSTYRAATGRAACRSPPPRLQPRARGTHRPRRGATEQTCPGDPSTPCKEPGCSYRRRRLGEVQGQSPGPPSEPLRQVRTGRECGLRPSALKQRGPPHGCSRDRSCHVAPGGDPAAGEGRAPGSRRTVRGLSSHTLAGSSVSRDTG